MPRSTYILHNFSVCTHQTQICYTASVLCAYATYLCCVPSPAVATKHIYITWLSTLTKICSEIKCKHFMKQSDMVEASGDKKAEKAFEVGRTPSLEGFFGKCSKTARLDCRLGLRYNIGEKRAFEGWKHYFRTNIVIHIQTHKKYCVNRWRWKVFRWWKKEKTQ